MSETPHRDHTAEDWTGLIEAYLESRLTQKAFCVRQDISFHRFRHRYQRSPLFRGKRRQKRATGFQSVIVPEARSTAARPWVVLCGDQLRIECPADPPIDAIVRLARGLSHDVFH